MAETTSLEIIIGTTDPWPHSYYLAHLAEVWRQQGITVNITGTPSEQGADLGFMHVDLSRLPASCRKMAAAYEYCVNGGISDISKTAYSQGIIARTDDWDGAVIVKTDLNYGGLPELQRRYQQFGGKLIKKLIKHNPWHFTKRFKPPNYPIFQHMDEVPEWAWRNRNLIVERFVPERVDDLYAIRYWIFFGNREYAVRFCSATPIVKAHNAVRREALPEIPEALRKIRAAMGMDFGKFDYVMHRGEPILLDINKTPSYHPLLPATVPSEEVLLLADGLKDFARR
ncbi:hypothetical protein Pcar_0953 [Syntrophotalea carbinolica DSM 2380]|uniref:ATP-grasp domain-containing protein n=1 Tax=Syntrophotalea carbinolica (strain DSM 2380 / NBRC 103641 / GraBd1) TaxID=338963 RepID=Q3A601_SYNC1|nr:hypothetical protein [Syntrophotalea carbinolica]ABA88206.1 hypothetical protein Pcar_0953 [Syntrophotalea carbinolica DSM 2380]